MAGVSRLHATLLAATAWPLQAATAQTSADLAYRFAGFTAVAGFEQAVADSLLAVVPGSVRDRAGSVVVILGAGAPVRLIACPLDETGYVVGNILPEGFLTLRRVGSVPSPLFDQWHEGQLLTVWTRGGPRPAVMAIPSTHLTRGRNTLSPDRFTVDDARVEVGARTAREVGDLGIALLDPVALRKAPHRYGAGLLAAPESGRRAACAALAHALRAGPRPRGTIVAAFVVESRIRHRGLLTAGNRHGPLAETVLLNYPVPQRLLEQSFGEVRHWDLMTRYPDTPVETVALDEVERLARRIRDWLGGAR